MYVENTRDESWSRHVSDRIHCTVQQPFNACVPNQMVSLPCNENQLDALFVLSLFVSHLPHVSGIFVAHHQEVFYIYTAVGTCGALQLTVWWPVVPSLEAFIPWKQLYEMKSLRSWWLFSQWFSLDAPHHGSSLKMNTIFRNRCFSFPLNVIKSCHTTRRHSP